MSITKVLTLDPKNPDRNSLKLAARCVAEGGLVAIPTETVYGIAVDVNNPEAVQRLYAVKGRPPEKPLTVHVAHVEQIPAGSIINQTARALMGQYWPGPLTIIVGRTDGVTVGLRMPSNSIAREFLSLCAVTVGAPSANVSGVPAPTAVEPVIAAFGDTLDYILDGGVTEYRQASTIVDTTSTPARIVRQGALVIDSL